MLVAQFRKSIEASLARLGKDEIPASLPQELQYHPIAAKGTFAFLTGHSPRYPTDKDVQSPEQIRQEMTQTGIKHDPSEGAYGEPEPTNIVYNPTRKEMVRLAKRYGQEAVIYSSNGQHEYIFTNGPNAGKYHPGKPGFTYFAKPPADAYTRIPGFGYVRMDFDWDKLLPVPKSDMGPVVEPVKTPQPETPAPEAAAKSEVTRDDIAKRLAKSIQNRITAFTEEINDIRERELSKSDGTPLVSGMNTAPTDFTVGAPNLQGANMIDGICPLCGNDDAPGSCTCLNPQADVVLKMEEERCPICGKYGYCGCVSALHKAEPCQKCGKGMCKCSLKSEDFIDLKNANTPGKRHVEKPGPHEGVVPGDVKIKDTPGAEGSGGQITKGKKGKKVEKGEIPAVTNHSKSKLQVIRDAASQKHVPQAPVPAAPAPVQKADVPAAKPPSGKMPTPAKPPMSGSKPLGKAALPAAPRSRATAAAEAAHSMRGQPAPQAAAPAPAPKMPSQAEHAARAQQFADFTPPGKFSQPAGIGLTSPKPAGAAPKVAAPVAKPAVKPAVAPAPAPQKPAAPAPMLRRSEQPIGEDFAKSLGNCALCGKAEHAGECK